MKFEYDKSDDFLRALGLLARRNEAVEQKALAAAYRGDWVALVQILDAHPAMELEMGSSAKGYTILYQAAWHGAEGAVKALVHAQHAGDRGEDGLRALP